MHCPLSLDFVGNNLVAFLLTVFNAFATYSALGVAAGSAKSFLQARFAGASPSFALGLFDKLDCLEGMCWRLAFFGLIVDMS